MARVISFPAAADALPDDDGDVTLIVALPPRPAAGPALMPAPTPDGDETRIEAPAAPLAEPAPAPAPAAAAIAAGLFAEPPRLPQRSPKTVTEGTPRSRRRKLLLLAVMMVGAWTTLGGNEPAPPPVTSIRAVTPSEAWPPQRLALPIVSRRAPRGPVSADRAADHLAAGRYQQALPLYRALAAEHPDQPVYQVIADTLAGELDARCRAERSSSCSTE